MRKTLNPEHHKEALTIARNATEMALASKFGHRIDASRVSAGGYSVGASLAAFLAAQKFEIDALVYWGPSGAPYWLGVNAKKLYSNVTQPALYSSLTPDI